MRGLLYFGFKSVDYFRLFLCRILISYNRFSFYHLPGLPYLIDLLLVYVSLSQFFDLHLFGHADLLVVLDHLSLFVLDEEVQASDHSGTDDHSDQQSPPFEFEDQKY